MNNIPVIEYYDASFRSYKYTIKNCIRLIRYGNKKFMFRYIGYKVTGIKIYIEYNN